TPNGLAIDSAKLFPAIRSTIVQGTGSGGSTNWYIDNVSIEGDATLSSPIRARQFYIDSIINVRLDSFLTTLSGATPPGAPTATAATVVNATNFIANWNTVSTANGYKLDVALDNGFTSYVSGYQNLSVTSNSRYVVGLSP